MRKSDIVSTVKKLGLTSDQATKVVSEVFDSILTALAKRDTVSITGFGVFSPLEKSAGPVRNPKNGETVEVDAHIKPQFMFAESVRLTFRNGEETKYL